MSKIDTKEIENTVKKFFIKHRDNIIKLVFIIIVFSLGMIIRIKLLPYIHKDMSGYLTTWYKYIQSHGGFACVGDKIGDLPPMYYYFLAIMTYTKLPVHIAIKWISIVFDIIMAIYVMKIVELKDGKASFYPSIAFAVVFCLPTVVLNSSAWGQNDAIYTTFLIMCLYYILKGSDVTAMIMLGVSLSFKFQAFFILPVIAILTVYRKIRYKSLLWIPGTYLITIIPAVISGGNIFRLISVCFTQINSSEVMSTSLANGWAFCSSLKNAELGSAGIWFAFLAALIFVFYFSLNKQLRLTKNALIGLTTLSAFIIPFLLPYMHERYMFFTEIMFVIFAFYNRQKMWLIALSQFCSVSCLVKTLYNQQSIDLRILSIVWIIGAFAVFDIVKKENNSSDTAEELTMRFEQANTNDIL